ncbi:MAG: DNA mismatch repair protein MutS, partial [Bdellovibrionales bacterium]|nr:DNA mismatch repair protein MutS [Bdellovibrionales bacterium]
TLLENAHQLATLDVVLGFATAAKVHDWTRPSLHEGWDLKIDEGRHPVVETLLEKGKFVPNTVEFNESARTLILTGPNMSGKSTIMRQVALISVMAQAGSFIPAKKTHLPLVDAVYTRIGSSDDLAGGRSTFMVEMTEMARILRQATENSLILVDEIGRGTSTYDGLSLAWSLIEFMHNEVRAKTLFATHFHEVTSLEQHAPGIKNMNVLVEKWEGEIVFLHKLAPGICNRSYGIEVAALASLPQPVLVRARDILGHLESQSQRNTRNRSHALQMHQNQMTFFE